MIGTCKDCGTEKEIHGNGLCNACYMKHHRVKHNAAAIPGKAERDQQGKVRKIGSAILDQYNKSIDLNQIVPGTIPDELLESLKIVGDTILYGSRVTTSATPEEGDDGDEDNNDGAGEQTAPVPAAMRQEVIKALLALGYSHSSAILYAYESSGETATEWIKAALARATGVRNATKSSPVALPSNPEFVVEERNATPEEGRCVALPDVTRIHNVTPAPAAPVMVEPEGRNVTETTDVTSPAIIPEMPSENIKDVEAVAVVKSESDTHHEAETLAEPDSGILKVEALKSSPAVPAAEQPASQEYG